MNRRRFQLLLATSALAVLGGTTLAAPIRIEVDASEAPRRIFHARLEIPVRPGPLTLLYPKWLPGEHGPTGPLVNLAGLVVQANGSRVPWTRDPLDLYAFEVEVPQGSSTLEVSLDFLSPVEVEGFSSAASATAQLAVLSWNQLLLYPEGEHAGTLPFRASLRVPLGWKHATSLPIVSESPEGIEFAEVPLATLIDAPVAMGAHARIVPLAATVRTPHEIDLFADSEAALEIPEDLSRGYDRLVEEAQALFGSAHYERYRFLLTLSDSIAHFGLEHHESSDNRVHERALVNPDRRRGMIGLLPHELVHSWNGKYRRPADLTTDDFRAPAKTDLLWVYEGLTSYLGDVLTARSRLRPPEEARDHLAWLAASLEHTPGRAWRPLVDTSIAAQLLYEAPDAWGAWRRGVDFYDEGVMLWLEADTLIRTHTAGQRSLDDFCRSFFGGASGSPVVSTYTFDDLIVALGEVAAADWRSFFRERLETTTTRAPLGGIEAGGWKLVYAAEQPQILKSREEAREITDLTFSIGLALRKDGTVIDVVPGLPAASAGIAPGMKLVAVGWRKWTSHRLREAIRAATTHSEEIELLVDNADSFRTFSLDYHGGERYPHLVRNEARPDLLSAILQPRVAPR